METKETLVKVVKGFAPLLLTLTILLMSFEETSARKYHPESTKKRAIEMLRANSEELCELVGLEPIKADSTIIKEMMEESELLSDYENESEEIAEDPDFDEENIDNTEVEDYDDVEVTKENFRKQWLSYVDRGEDSNYLDNGIRKDVLMESIMSWLGTPYRFGGISRKSIDCSAFVRAVFEETAGIRIPRTARYQYKIGERIEKMEDLKFGDIVFFHTRSYAYASHCGIYLGDNLFAQASSRYGVTISSLESTYYNNRFIGGSRLSYEDIIKFDIVNNEEDAENVYGG